MRLSKWSDVLPWFALMLIMGVGAWARWRYIQAGIFHVDEFISMLAIKMILEKGQPVFPSGLFYDNGLVFSYLGAGVAHLAGGDLLAARWWSLTMGVFAVVLVYVLCWQLFGVRWWGLVAAVAMASLSEAIEWGGRVRMYSQANFVILMWILLAWWGTLGGRHRWARWALIGALWFGLNTHFFMLLAVPPLAFSLLLVWLLRGNVRVDFGDIDRRFLIEVGVAVVVLALSVWMGSHSFIAGHAVRSSSLGSNSAMAHDNLVSSVLDIRLDGARLAKEAGFFLRNRMFPLTMLTLLGTLVVVIRTVQQQFGRPNLACLLLVLTLVGILAERLLFLSDEWRALRYNFLVVFPLMLLVAVYGLHSLAGWVVTHLPSSNQWVRLLSLAAVAALGFVWPVNGFWVETIDVINGTTDTPNQYNLAFDYVNEKRAPRDQLLTIRTAAGYLFSERLDFYANQTAAVIMPGSDGWVDRYAGVPYLADVEDLNRALDLPGTLWFVVDTERLFERFQPSFTQQVLQRMTSVRSLGNIWVLREMEGTRPLAKTQDEQVTVTLGGNIRFAGYAWGEPSSMLPGGTAHLTLFWEADEQLLAYKVFVHLRDGAGNIVTQADFVPLEALNDELREPLITQAQAEFVRLGTAVSFPLDLTPGGYTLWAGLYEAHTLQRLPVINDTTGENAILLGDVAIR